MPQQLIFAEGIADHLEAMRQLRGDGSRSAEAQLLIEDREAAAFALPRPEGMAVHDSFLVDEGKEIPLRIYRPADASRAAIVYLHGGGFTTGSIATFDTLTAQLADESKATVISVGYRRMPQATPGEIQDEAFRAFCWAVEHADLLNVDAKRIGLAGDSAGAMIAARLALRLRDGSEQQPACLALFYGLYDAAMPPDDVFAKNYPVLTRPVCEAMRKTYRECAERDPGPQVELLETELDGLAPTILVHAEYDVLLDQGRAFAERLEGAGVVTQSLTAHAMPHGFLRALKYSPPARAYLQSIGTKIAAIL